MMTSSTLERQLSKVEALLHERAKRRFNAACDAVKRDLTDEQKAGVRTWFDREEPDPETPCPARHRRREFCDRCIEVVNPPALVRAMWMLVMWHMREGSPALLPPNVAQVYVDDPDAWPIRACATCGYRLPTRAKLRADRSFREIALYAGVCPSCETPTGEVSSDEADHGEEPG
jgi:hypothetical protein